jgi:site-specific DNA-methyltransferase (adenine-specific)
MTYQRKEVIGDAVLYLADCRDWLASLPPCFTVDAVVTDPPYGVSYQGSATKHTLRDGEGYASFEDTPEEISSVCVPAVRAAVALARSAVMTPGNACSHLYDPPRAQGAIFYPSGANAGPWGFVCSQPLFYYGKDPFLALGKGRRPNGFSTTESAEKNGHPCPKPIGQTRWMVCRVSFPGETVLDPFMGSGTTGVACALDGRRFIGIEQEPAYFDIACRRIEEAYRQPRLFDEPPPKPVQPSLLGDLS